ncbi:Fluc/FEX family fluoride channel [Arthrobacter sp. PsM3]|uniref:Fluc/FEX family fluoride channel n=1 Tax=Arthrobacter sp. PsM3 TaxID=3030531 RepID=UPI00346152C9
MSGANGRRAWAAVAVGGLIGTELRYGAGLVLPEAAGTIPWTTLVINVVGSFILAALTTVWIARPKTAFWLRAGLGPGLLGSFTNFFGPSWFEHHPGRHPHWPWATLTVNAAGSFIPGAARGITGQLGLGAEWQSGRSAGLAGGLTTFSSWTTATVRLVSETRYRAAALSIAANLVAGLAAAALGLALTGL